jgi:Cft2 family RNA processing exonuclease
MQQDIEFTSILNREKHGATCNLLRIGELTLMFDAGCDESASQENCLKVVAEHAAKAHYIFLSHATYMQLGSLPYLQKIGLLGQNDGSEETVLL